jgi:DnaK suppressor protein
LQGPSDTVVGVNDRDLDVDLEVEGEAGEPGEVLRALRVDLEARAAALRTGATVPSGGISFGKRVGEGTSIAIERFADVAIHDQIVQQMSLVDAALARLDDGTYGDCEVCRKPIAPERLEVIPWAATCVACA